MFNVFQIMLVLYSTPETVDEMTTCNRKSKGKGVVEIIQPLIAQQFDDFMGGVDVWQENNIHSSAITNSSQ